MLPALAKASDLTWDNGSGNFMWDTTSLNWSGSTWPVSSSGADGATFGATGVGTITNQTGGIPVNHLTFSTAGYTLAGDPLTLDGTSPSITNGVNAIINANLIGTAGLLKAGNGTLTLGGTNSSLSGALVIGGATSGNAGGVVLRSSAVGGISSINIQSNSFLGLASATVGSGVPITAAGAGGFSTPPGTILSASGVSAVNGSVSIADGAVRLGNQNGSSLTFNGPVTAPVGSGYGLLLRYGLNQGLIFTNPANYWEGATALSQGSFWFYPGALPAASRAVIAGSGNAWLETSGSLTRSLGTTGTNQIDMSISTAGRIVGLSARGGDLTVNFGGSGGTINWGGTAGFNPAILGLNGPNANGQLTLQNDVDLNGATRTVEVDAGVAEISGLIKNSTGTAGLTKPASAGVLLLSHANTYNGGTTISGSSTYPNALRISNGSALGTGSVTIGSGGNADKARLELTGGITVANSFASFTSRNSTAPNFLNVSGTNTITANISSGGGGGQVTLQSDVGKLILTGSISTRQLNLLGDGDGELSGSIPLQGTYGIYKDGIGTWTISGAGTYVGGLTNNAGTLNINSTTALGAAAGTFTINGGTIDNTSAGAITLANNNPQNWNGDFTFTGTQDLNLGTGAVTMNAARQVTVNGGTLTVGGAISDSGAGYGLTKLGAGTLELDGVNTYIGDTTINAGTLVGMVGGSCANSAVSVAATAGNTATLSIPVPNVTQQWTCSSLTVNNAGTSSGLSFNFGSLTPDATVAPLNVSGAISFLTAPVISVSGASLPVSSGNGYPLVTWGLGSPTTAGMVLILPARIAGNLAIVGNTLYLQITGSTEPLTWQPGSGIWNTTSDFWKDSAGTTTAYIDGTPGDSVKFDDTPGAGNYIVSLNDNYQPAGVILDNTNASYTISGTGSIGGAGTFLTKNGSGTLTLANANTYTGNTTINAGTLQLGDGSVNNGSVAGAIIDNASLVIANPLAQTNTSLISGTGSLTKAGAGSLIMTGANPISGPTTINAGILQLGDGAANNGSVAGAITNNAALVFANPSTQTNSSLISGTGSLTKTGAGTLVMIGANPITGPVQSVSGKLQFGDGTANNGSVASANIVANGGTVAFANYASQTYTGVISSTNTAGGGAALSLVGTDNLTLNLSSTNALSSISVSSGTNTINGGTLNLSGNLSLNGTTTPVLNLNGVTINAQSSYLYVGSVSSTAGILNVNSGCSINCPSFLMVAYGSGGITSTLNLNGGTVTANPIRLTQHGSGYLWLNGGLLQVSYVDFGGTAGDGYAHMYFNGGTLKATAASTTFINANLSDCNVSTNASTIDNAGYAITIPMAIQHDYNVPGTDGGLIFTGTNTTTLTGYNSYTGPTVVQNGVLAFSSDKFAGGGALAVSNGTVQLTVPSYTSLNVSQLGLTNATLLLDYGTAGAQAGYFNAINVSGNYAADGTNTIVIKGSGFVDGTQIVLIHYSGTEAGSATYVASVPVGYGASIQDDTVNNQIVLTINSVPAALTWKGTSSLWDTNNAANTNWVLTSDLFTPEYYLENALGGSAVSFDDNVAGGSTAITLNQTVSPLSVTVNSSGYDYSITGTGKISGPGSLAKSASGTLVLGTANDYTGGTVLAGGSLVLTNGSNRLPTAGVLTFSGNGTLNLGGYSQTLGMLTMSNSTSSTSTVSNGAVVVTGSASVTGNGAGAFTKLNMSSASSLTMSNPSGSLTVGGAYGATAATSGAELFLPSSTSLTLNQLSVGTYGAFNDATATNYGLVHLGQSAVINASQITLGTTRAEGTLDFATNLVNPTVTLRNTNGASSRVDQINVGQNGAGGTPQGFGLLNLSPGTVDALVSNLVVGSIVANSATNGQGTMTFSNGTLDVINLTLGRNYTVGGTGGPNGTFIQSAGTNKVQTLALGDNAGLTGAPRLSATYTLNGGVLKAGNINGGSGSFTNTSSRTVNWNGGIITHYDAASDLTISGPVNGNINLVIGNTGTGTPTMAVDSGRTITVGSNAVINGAAPLLKNGAGTLVLDCTSYNGGNTEIANGTLAGTALLAGPLTIDSGATLAPGAGGIGTLTANGGFTLNGNLYFELNKSLTQSNDSVVLSGSVTNAGTGTLTLDNVGAPALADGDTFQLFSQPLPGGENLTLNPTTPGSGLAWVNELAINGSVSVVASSTVATNVVPITYSFASGSLNLSWPPDHLGWTLQVQTNTLAKGLSTNWTAVAGSTTLTNYSATVDHVSGSVFYRLIYLP